MKNPIIIKAITPGTPKIPAIKAVTMLNGIVIPIAIPNVFTKNIIITPSTTFTASFSIFFTGHASNLATTITAIAANIKTT